MRINEERRFASAPCNNGSVLQQFNWHRFICIGLETGARPYRLRDTVIVNKLLPVSLLIFRNWPSKSPHWWKGLSSGTNLTDEFLRPPVPSRKQTLKSAEAVFPLTVPRSVYLKQHLLIGVCHHPNSRNTTLHRESEHTHPTKSTRHHSSHIPTYWNVLCTRPRVRPPLSIKIFFLFFKSSKYSATGSTGFPSWGLENA